MPYRPPVGNKTIEKYREAKAYESHRERVVAAKSVTDTTPPRAYIHQHINMKRLQIEEDRLSGIEQQNKKLLEKMSHIMRSGGHVDNWNTSTFNSSRIDSRRREQLKIAKENRRIYDKIILSKPEYDHVTLEEEWKINQKRIQDYSAYNPDGTEKYLPKNYQKTKKANEPDPKVKKVNEPDSSENKDTASDHADPDTDQQTEAD